MLNPSGQVAGPRRSLKERYYHEMTQGSQGHLSTNASILCEKIYNIRNIWNKKLLVSKISCCLLFHRQQGASKSLSRKPTTIFSFFFLFFLKKSQHQRFTQDQTGALEKGRKMYRCFKSVLKKSPKSSQISPSVNSVISKATVFISMKTIFFWAL